MTRHDADGSYLSPQPDESIDADAYAAWLLDEFRDQCRAWLAGETDDRLPFMLEDLLAAAQDTDYRLQDFEDWDWDRRQKEHDDD